MIENDPNKDGDLGNLFETNFSAAQEYCQSKNLKFDLNENGMHFLFRAKIDVFDAQISF